MYNRHLFSSFSKTSTRFSFYVFIDRGIIMAFLVASSTYYGLEKVDAVPRDHSVYRFIAAR